MQPRLESVTNLHILTKLKDGSLVEYQNIDDLLTSENGGQKSVVRLTLTCDDGHEEPKSYVSVEFNEGFENPASWTSIMRSVVGDSRDAVFVAAADLDDRIKKIQITSWSYIVGSRFVFMIATVIGMMASLWFLGFFASSSSVTTADELQMYYDSGKIRDPIQAIIELERLKSNRPMWPFYLFPAPMIAIFLIAWFLQYLIPKISRSYVFFTGGMPRLRLTGLEA
jgi:hypothetical protein